MDIEDFLLYKSRFVKGLDERQLKKYCSYSIIVCAEYMVIQLFALKREGRSGVMGMDTTAPENIQDDSKESETNPSTENAEAADTTAAYSVPIFYHTLYQLGSCFQEMPYYKKCGRAADTTAENNSPAPRNPLVLQSEDWGLNFVEEGSQPKGNADASDLAAYNAYFVGSNNEKVIYLTFDCGYENGNTKKT